VSDPEVTVTPGRLRRLSATARRPAGSASYVGGLLIALALLVAMFSLVNHHFLNPDNFLGILRNVSSVALIGLGLTLVIIVGEIDISFGYAYGLVTTVVGVSWVIWGWPVYLALLLGFGVAILIGAFNAFFTIAVKIPSLIVTLGSGTLIYGFTLLLGGSANISPSYPPPGKSVDPGQLAFFDALSAKLAFGVSAQILWLIVFAVIFYLLLHRSIFGFRLTAVGGNTGAAVLVLGRRSVATYKAAALIICTSMAALAGILDFSFVSSTAPNAGQGFLFPVFTAVVIGGTSLTGGRGSIIGTLIGSLLLSVIAIGLALIAAGSFVQQVVLGTMTLLAVALDQYTHRRT
jgi:ribose/xylose/arabinose/galactoside ABC-type transport system permease subunit